VAELSRSALWVFAFIMILTVTLSTLFVGTSVSHVGVRGYMYQNAPQIPPNAAAILASFGTSLTPAQISTLKAQFGAGGFQNLSANGTRPSLLSTYLQTISNVSSNLAEIGVLIQQGQGSLAIGDMKSVEVDIRALDALTSGTENLIGSSTNTLNEISVTYGINTSSQASKVQQLNEELQGYMPSIDELKLKASERSYQGTALSLNASLSRVFVEANFSVAGVLSWKQTPLPGRSITISWGPTNESLSTNSTGGFQTNLSFPFGTPSGPSVVEAFYQPSGNDTSLYEPAYSAVQVTVKYVQTEIYAKLTPSTVRPPEPVLITGNLTTVTGRPLIGRSISVQLNGSPVSNTTTVTDGAFYFILTIPGSARNATYNATVSFNPSSGVFGETATSLQFTVITIPTVMELKVGQGLILSGSNVTLAGKVTYSNGTAVNRGALLIYVDNILYANTTAIRNGTFDYSVGLPILTGFGSHSFTVSYLPAQSWINSSQNTVTVYVLNMPLVLTAAATMIGVSVGSMVWLRRRRVTVAAPPPSAVTAEAVLERPRPSPPKLERVQESLAEIQTEVNSNLKVRRSFTLAQTLIDAKLREEHALSETAWEYYSRVTKRLAQITDSLRQLTQLFELADYSQLPITQAQADSALRAATFIRDKVGA